MIRCIRSKLACRFFSEQPFVYILERELVVFVRQLVLLEVCACIFLAVLQIYLSGPQILRVLQLCEQVWDLDAIGGINQADACERLPKLLVPQHFKDESYIFYIKLIIHILFIYFSY